PWRRDTTPLLFYGETPIAAADDLFVTTEGEVKESLRSSGRSWALLRGDETPRRCCFTAKRRLPQRTICL
ncbi:hypothetical protein C7D71_25685, partial [Klebsiella pneumoniae]